MPDSTIEAAVAGKIASDRVYEYVNQRTQVGSTEHAVQSLVRRAYVIVWQAQSGHVDDSVADAWCDAVGVATGGQVRSEDIRRAVEHDRRGGTA